MAHRWDSWDALLNAKDLLEGLRIVLDCANGAGYKVAPTVFRELGAEVIPMGVAPDGHNINRGCGSTRSPTATRCASSRRRAAAPSSTILGCESSGLKSMRLCMISKIGVIIQKKSLNALHYLDLDVVSLSFL